MRAGDWLSRYGAAECAGLACAFAASALVRHLTRNSIATGYAAAWGETIGYASMIAVRDVSAGVQRAHRANQSFGFRNARRLLTQWLTEFGPAGVLDTLVTRPFCMGLGMHWFGPVRGLLAGKVAADVLFYIPVIFVYERRKRAERES